MTNRERYQRAFSALHASESCLMEVKAMKRTGKHYAKRLTALCAAAVLVLGLATAVYAADVGGIQRTIQLWIDGDRTDAVLDIRGSEYTVTYQDADGETRQFGGGGVAFENGTERPLTEAEITEQLNGPDVQYRKDGTVWICWQGQETELTDRFDEDGVCYVQLTDDSGPLYLTVKYQAGFASSPHCYIAPGDFNTGD